MNVHQGEPLIHLLLVEQTEGTLNDQGPVCVYDLCATAVAELFYTLVLGRLLVAERRRNSCNTCVYGLNKAG